jgi:hypothetical protein
MELHRDNVAQWVRVLPALRKWLDALEVAAKELVASEGGVPAGEGRTLHLIEKVKRFPVLTGQAGAEAEAYLVGEGMEAAISYRLNVDGSAARDAVDALRKAGIPVEVKPETSWTAIKRVGGAKGERQVREALTAMGAVVDRTHEEWDERAA